MNQPLESLRRRLRALAARAQTIEQTLAIRPAEPGNDTHLHPPQAGLCWGSGAEGVAHWVPCPDTCPTDGEVMVTVSGMAACGCNASGTLQVSAFSGVNAVHTLPWVEADGQFVLADIGSVTIDTYGGADCPGGTITATDTGKFTLRATCSNGLWSLTIEFSSGPTALVFTTGSNVALGETITNTTVCTGAELFAGGSAVIER